MGKCYYSALPKNLVPLYVVNTFVDMGLVSQENLDGAGIDDSALDINYIIVVNDDLIKQQDNSETVEEVVLLHELCHIKPEMDGLLKHDTEDFAFILESFGIHWTNGEISSGTEDQES